MSTSIREVLETPTSKPYLQSPVDDMESFYWVALWAALRNNKVHTQTEQEKKWRKGIRGNTLERTAIAYEVGLPAAPGELKAYNPILRSMWPLLATWRHSLVALRAEWKEHLFHAGDWSNDTNILYFDKLAYKGALTFLHAMKTHIADIRQAELSQDRNVPTQ